MKIWKKSLFDFNTDLLDFKLKIAEALTRYLDIDVASLTLGSSSNSSGSFNISSNTSWTISDNASWLTVSPTSGSNGRTITVTATSANSTTNPRNATITISATGVSPKTVTVTQQGASQYLKVTSPNGGESWQLGSTHSISWQSSAGRNVKIELYKGSNKYKTISSNTSNDGNYSWNIPTSYDEYSSYRIKITSTSNSSLYDYCNAPQYLDR